MNTTINNLKQKKPLPQLIKQSSTYKMIVPAKVEAKIRYLCRKFPTLEWSGVLFTTHEGSFEDNNLVITCQDFYPMDLGSPGFTQFRMDETVAGYIAENIELFDADVNLIHSHNKLQCFFSGQDQATLREEGNDKNCFVSLIVNNEGSYCAAVTRKIQKKTKVVTTELGASYEFFGDGPVTIGESSTSPEKVFLNEVIEYFMLNVEVEKVENPLAYLDDRFEEIEAKKKASTPAKSLSTSNSINLDLNYTRVYYPKKGDTTVIYGNDYDEDKDFFDWIHDERKKKEEATEQSLFSEGEMEEMIDTSLWRPDEKIIHYLAAQLLTSSLIINKDIDLKQWVVKYMEKKYDEIFSGGNSYEFGQWADAYVEFIVNHYSEENVPEEVLDYFDDYQAHIAKALIDELDKYPSNEYIGEYQKILEKYLV